MAITASAVKELRELTGAGMMDCKKALTATDGDMTKAVDFLREKGLAASAKKAGRIAAEGIVSVLVEGSKAVIVEVNSETDFVAKNDKFRSFVADVLKQIISTDIASVEELLEQKWINDDTITVAEAVSAQVAVIGENIKIRRFARFENSDGVIADYIHGEGRIGVLLNVDTDAKDNDIVKALFADLCMQIAAMNPVYVSREDISDEYIKSETAIILAAALNENAQLSKPKPEAIIEKNIVPGRLNKQLKEVCLLDQAFVKDGDFTVGQFVQKIAKDNAVTINIKGFVRFETGEGIEKKEEDFAAEVAAQMGN